MGCGMLISCFAIIGSAKGGLRCAARKKQKTDTVPLESVLGFYESPVSTGNWWYDG